MIVCFEVSAPSAPGSYHGASTGRRRGLVGPDLISTDPIQLKENGFGDRHLSLWKVLTQSWRHWFVSDVVVVAHLI